MRILFAAAENAALPGGKVGGIGDVIRDLPPALAARGGRVTVVTPSHGFLHQGAGAGDPEPCRFMFRGAPHTAGIYTVEPPDTPAGVKHRVIHHPMVSALDASGGGHRIYTHDPPDRPYFTDATRFAFFCGAVAAAVSSGLLGPFDVIHLHDWHAALVLLLGRFHPDYAVAGKLHTVFSIHNLAFQGIRPLRDDESSLAAWFPELDYDWNAVSDPRWPGCINAMAVGIRSADRVHTVSPSYARQIRQPGQKPRFYGGEGLEADLEQAHRDGRLTGILNGCLYPPWKAADHIRFHDLMALIRREAIRLSAGGETVSAAHFTAFARALEWSGRSGAPDMLLTVVSRVGEQKMLLLRHSGGGKPALHRILEGIGPRGCCIVLGSGDPEYERFLAAAGASHENFIFINGYSEQCAQALYSAGDLFLMPSSFEPCGLSQMLAMREGQPCVVHAVGGLKDTVLDGRNGFSFTGATVDAQAGAFVQTTLDAVRLKHEKPDDWAGIRKNAAAARFTWEETAGRYFRELYDPVS